LYPGAVPARSYFETAVDRCESQLDDPLLIGEDELDLVDASRFPSVGAVNITYDDNTSELAYYTGKTGDRLTGLTRGVQSVEDDHGTNQTAYLSRTEVHHNRLAEELAAGLAELGSNPSGASDTVADRFTVVEGVITGLALNSLTDVDVPAPADLSVLRYNDGSGNWEAFPNAADNLQEVTAIGNTTTLPIEVGRILTVNGQVGYGATVYLDNTASDAATGTGILLIGNDLGHVLEVQALRSGLVDGRVQVNLKVAGGSLRIRDSAGNPRFAVETATGQVAVSGYDFAVSVGDKILWNVDDAGDTYSVADASNWYLYNQGSPYVSVIGTTVSINGFSTEVQMGTLQITSNTAGQDRGISIVPVRYYPNADNFIQIATSNAPDVDGGIPSRLLNIVGHTSGKMGGGTGGQYSFDSVSPDQYVRDIVFRWCKDWPNWDEGPLPDGTQTYGNVMRLYMRGGPDQPEPHGPGTGLGQVNIGPNVASSSGYPARLNLDGSIFIQGHDSQDSFLRMRGGWSGSEDNYIELTRLGDQEGMRWIGARNGSRGIAAGLTNAYAFDVFGVAPANVRQIHWRYIDDATANGTWPPTPSYTGTATTWMVFDPINETVALNISGQFIYNRDDGSDTYTYADASNWYLYNQGILRVSVVDRMIAYGTMIAINGVTPMFTLEVQGEQARAAYYYDATGNRAILSTDDVSDVNTGRVWVAGEQDATEVGIGQVPQSGYMLAVSGDFASANAEVGSAGWVYMGNPTTNGSWRMGRSGNNLVLQRRESAVWNTKQTVTA
jgi:hypothetical protein